jgi:hypothetical protein
MSLTKLADAHHENDLAGAAQVHGTLKLGRSPLGEPSEGERSEIAEPVSRLHLLFGDRTPTARDWLSSLKVAASSTLIAQTSVEYNRTFLDQQLEQQRAHFGKMRAMVADPSLQGSFKRITELASDCEIAPRTASFAKAWLIQLRRIVRNNQMYWHEPLINAGIDSEVVFEWWRAGKKITVYVLNGSADYIKVWGPNMDTEMQEGLANSDSELTSLWQWLGS